MQPAGGMIRIVEARAEHAPGVAALHEQVIEEDRYFITAADEFDPAVEREAERIRDMARRENCLFLVGLAGDRVVACLTLQGGVLARMRHVARLEIMVASDFRGQGIGEALLKRAIEWAEKNRHLSKLSLAVFEDNERAVALYQKAGFTVEGRRPAEYRERDGRWRSDLLMWRWVGSEPAPR